MMPLVSCSWTGPPLSKSPWSLPQPPFSILTFIVANIHIFSACNPNLKYNYSDDGKSIVSVTVTTNGNACSVKVPVTVPGTATSTAGTLDKVGNEPAIYWTQMSNSPVTYTLGAPVAV